MADLLDESLLTDPYCFGGDSPSPTASASAASAAATATAATADLSIGARACSAQNHEDDGDGGDHVQSPSLDASAFSHVAATAAKADILPCPARPATVSHRPFSSLPRGRDSSIGGLSASTATTTSTVSSLLLSKTKSGNGVCDESSRSSLSSNIPPPSFYDFGDFDVDEESSVDGKHSPIAGQRRAVQKIAGSQVLAVQEPDDREVYPGEPDGTDYSVAATPKLDTPTTTPVAEKPDPIEAALAQAPSPHASRTRRQAEDGVSACLSQSDGDAISLVLDLPAKPRRAGDLESERSSSSAFGHKLEGGSIYFTAAGASPQDAPSSVRSEPSFSPQRDSLSPIDLAVHSPGTRGQQPSTGHQAAADSAGTPPTSTVPAVAADTELFVARLRESIWRSVGKTRQSKDYTQDWLSQCRNGLPRTERTNWLSDDESSPILSEEDIVAGDLLSFDDESAGSQATEGDPEADQDRDDGTSTTVSYKTALNRAPARSDSPSDWLDLDEEASGGEGSEGGKPGVAAEFHIGSNCRDSRRSTVTLKQEDLCKAGLALEDDEEQQDQHDSLPNDSMSPSIIMPTDTGTQRQLDADQDSKARYLHSQLERNGPLSPTATSPVGQQQESRSRSVSPQPSLAEKPLPPPPPPPKQDATTPAHAPALRIEVPLPTGQSHSLMQKASHQHVNQRVGTPASPASSTATFGHLRKRVLWRKRVCIIALPIDDPRTDLFGLSQCRERLARFEEAGRDTRGWDTAPTDGETGEAGSALTSQPMFPDPDEVAAQWRELKNALTTGAPDVQPPVSFPNQKVWDEYVQELQEAKLRALGVDLGDPLESDYATPQGFEAPSVIRRPTSTLDGPAAAPIFVPAVTPPLPTGSAASNPAYHYTNPFATPFASTPTGGNSLLAAHIMGGAAAPPFVMPGTAPTSAPHRLNAGSPLNQMLTTDAGPSPYLQFQTPAQMSFQQPNGLPNYTAALSGDCGEGLSGDGLHLPGGFAQYPGSRTHPGYVLPYNGLQEAQGYFPPASQQLQQPHLAADSSGNVEHDGAAEVELAQPLPDRHRHNVSDTLQQGLEHTEDMRRQSQARHLGGYNAGSEPYRTSYDPHSSQMYGDDGGGAASDIDTNPSVNGEGQMSTLVQHQVGMSKDSLPAYGSLYGPDGAPLQAHQAFSPPFSPNATGEPELLSPTGPPSQRGPWQSSFAMRAPSFNVEAPAFNPTSMGSALGLGAYPNGNSEEPIFQPPSRRKSIIPIRKPDDASSDEDSDQNGSMRHKKDESHDREHIRDSGVAMNGADGLKYDQLNGVEDPVPADAMQSGAGQQSHDNPNTSTKPPGASTLKPTAKPFEFHPGAPSFHAGPVEPPASSSPAVVVDSSKRDDAGGSTDADDIDAVMRQLNGDSDDLGIERALLAEPVQNGRTNGCSSSLSSSSHGMHGSGSPSPTIKASNGTSSTSLEPTASRFDASRLTPRKAMLPGAVQQIEIDPRNRRVSDYSDIIRDDEVHKLHTRAKYFDTRIHDIVGEILDARLRPLGTTLSTIHEAVHTLSRQGTLSGDRAVVAHARSHSYGIEDSDADDEDDGTTASQRRSLSPISRREARKIEKIKQAMLQALAAHRESQTSGFRPASQDEGRGAQETQAGADLAEVRSALAEIRELTRVRSGMIDVRPEDETAKVSLRQVVDEALAAHAAAQEQSRPSTRDSTQIIEEQLIAQLQSLKEMLRDSEQRADREMAMRKDAQDSLTECQHLLRFAEADSDKQRDLAERYAAELKELKEVRLPEADKIAEQYERLREEQRSTHWTLSELSEKNINLVGRLDETTVTGENLKAQSEKLKSENFELRQTASSLKTQLEERAQARLELRTKYDQLRADMLAASEEVARERAAWKAREEELALGNATMKAMYQQSIKAREQVDAKLHEMESIKAAYEREIRARQKLENDIADLEQQEKESSKFRVMLSQAQRENGQLNEVIIQLRQETQSSQKEISRLAREKDTIQSRCDRLKNEYEDSRENAKAEHERLSRQLHDIKAKAWADTEQLRTVLSETKAKHKDEVEKLEDEVDDLEIRRQEEVERLAAELAEVQKKSRTAIDRLKYELRFISNGKQEELNRLRAELDEVQSARRRDLERRDQQLSALAAKDQAKIDALKHDLNAAESLRRIDIQNMQREMDHLSSLKAQQKMEYDQQAEQLNQLEAELARARTAAETSDTSERSVSLLKAQISELELKHEEELASLRADLQAAKDESEIARARLEVELEQARESQSSALDDAADAHEKDLARERLNHEKTINDLRERHARALHNMTEDKTRHEAHIAEMMQVKEEKISHLQEKNDLLDDKVRHLQEKLDIAKAAAQAAAQAAQNARSSNVPSTAGSTVSLPQLSTAAAAQTLATTSAGSAAGPEKISPQALRESIIVLQDQLQQREQRIEELESKVATLDQDAPHKLKEKDTEIAWLRELLGVRLDDLQDIIATLSLENYDAAAARDAAIRLKANLDMEQQERERAMTGKGSFPSLDSIKDLAVSSKTLPLAAAAAWGSWRRKSSVIPERTESGATTAVSTPSKAAATAQSFLSGLLSPPSTAPRRGRLSPAPTTTASGPASRKSRTDSASTDSSSRVSSLQAKLIAAVANSESESAAGPSSPRIAPVSSTAEEPADARPQTPLFANADYDHDPPSTYFGEELLRLEADMHDESATGEQALLKESVSPLSGPHHDPEHPTALTARDEAFAPLSP